MNIKDLTITSPALGPGEAIPTRYTADGEDVCPALEFRGVPEGTRSLAVICHDPDAPVPHGFTHWVVYGTHHYFWLYALDEEIGAAPTLTCPELLDRMEGHIIEQNRLVGTSQR